MSEAHFRYWREALQSSFEEHAVTVTDEQLDAITRDIEGSHECYGMAFYSPDPPSVSEADRLRVELKAERDKVHCETCDGRGRISSAFGTFVSNSQCWKCRGEGRHAP